ncbi:unnamed protein product [Euphydryas editha]|uniref:Zinc finger PHD-type domain-containing protein n=1 Tax=Euphydryas editha TaxID=104508 RepID=A0AAU9UE85_EUPED|nr:unnamed protein product [Euphydryas editha]
MLSSCQACNVQVTDGLFIKCTKKLCEKVYDLKCLGITQEEFVSFSEKYTQKWVCPECICSKPKPIRYDSDTPVRSTPELNIFTPNPNVNTRRGSRLKMMDKAFVDCDCDSTLLAEFRSFKSEVFTRLDAQAEVIKHLQEICFSTKTELEKLRINMRVFQDKFTRKDLSLNNTQILENTDSGFQYLNTGNHKNLPTNFAEVSINTNKQNNSTRVTNMCEATKTVDENMTVIDSKSVSQPRQIVSSLELNNNSNNKNEEEKNNKDIKWTTIRKKRGSSITKNVKKGKNAELVEIQGIEKKILQSKD